ncbi:MAG: putative bifunctional diguanylate cyclase/phosphodiesterase [Oceanobacter sp.]
MRQLNLSLMISNPELHQCTTLLCWTLSGSGFEEQSFPVPVEAMESVDDVEERWRDSGEVVCLFARIFDEVLDSVVKRIKLKMPNTPLVVVLDEPGHLDSELIHLGVQDCLTREELELKTLHWRLDFATQRMALEQELRSLSNYDALTGLANRSLFNDRLEQSLIQASRSGSNVGLLFVDIDRFRVVNDLYGHNIGDQLIVVFAQRMSAKLRRSDTVSRLGGNSFAVILDSVRGINVANAVASKLVAALREPFIIDGHEIFVTISVGVDISSEANFDAGQMTRRAELALHQAKSDGRNTCQVYSPKVAPIDKVRIGLESALHHAMERNEVYLVYQPQVSVFDQHLVGAEVLLRWQHPILGNVSPAVFIPVLEETGLIEPFGEWVLRTACSQYQEWLVQGVVEPDTKISVNLSPRQFRQRDLGERIQNCIRESGLPPQNLVLEITESTLMYNLQQGAAMLSDLRKLGAAVAIDDFGTGYSSLAYLKDLPIDYLKIDRSFVKDIVDDANDAAIANSIIALAHNLGLKVIAEGVESEEILSQLQQFGCDQYQGYFFSKPIRPDELLQKVSGWQ